MEKTKKKTTEDCQKPRMAMDYDSYYSKDELALMLADYDFKNGLCAQDECPIIDVMTKRKLEYMALPKKHLSELCTVLEDDLVDADEIIRSMELDDELDDAIVDSYIFKEVMDKVKETLGEKLDKLSDRISGLEKRIKVLEDRPNYIPVYPEPTIPVTPLFPNQPYQPFQPWYVGQPFVTYTTTSTNDIKQNGGK